MRFVWHKPVSICAIAATLVAGSLVSMEVADAASRPGPSATLQFNRTVFTSYTQVRVRAVCASNEQGLSRMRAIVWFQVKNEDGIPLTPSESGYNASLTSDSRNTSAEYSSFMTAYSKTPNVKNNKKVRAKVKCSWTKLGDRNDFTRSAGSYIGPWKSVPNL